MEINIKANLKTKNTKTMEWQTYTLKLMVLPMQEILEKENFLDREKWYTQMEESLKVNFGMV